MCGPDGTCDIIHSDCAAQRNEMCGTWRNRALLLRYNASNYTVPVMVNAVVIWVCAHPLEFVGGLALACALMGVLLIPRLSELPGHGHPRC